MGRCPNTPQGGSAPLTLVAQERSSPLRENKNIYFGKKYRLWEGNCIFQLTSGFSILCIPVPANACLCVCQNGFQGASPLAGCGTASHGFLECEAEPHGFPGRWGGAPRSYNSSSMSFLRRQPSMSRKNRYSTPMPQSEPKNSSFDGTEIRIRYLTKSPAAAPARSGLRKQL